VRTPGNGFTVDLCLTVATDDEIELRRRIRLRGDALARFDTNEIGAEIGARGWAGTE
jgi:hypothetical protein